MAVTKRPFRTEESYAFERTARAAVVPFLRGRGVLVGDGDDVRRRVGRGESQVVRATLPDGTRVRMRVRLCWRRDGRNPREDLYSAAQLAAHTLDGDWGATLDRLTQRDLDEEITHTLFFQRNANSDVHAALVPTGELARIWWRQFEISGDLIAAGKLGRFRKNHAKNGDSPTLWLQDDRWPDSAAVSEVLWSWPGVLDLRSLPVVETTERAKYWRVVDALSELQGPRSVAEVKQWLESNAPGADYSDTRENLTLLTVNDANRRHYDSSRRFFRSDRGHPRDRVFRSNDGHNVYYEVYDLARHGVFDLARDGDGKYRVISLEVDEVAAAYAEAERHADLESEPLDSLRDARIRLMGAVVRRRGQREFRDALLRAYEGRCAISGCDVPEVLEAAHIVPYLGDHTQRADNGLLLRADIHTLFDLGKVWVDQEFKVRIDVALKGTVYEGLQGLSLRVPNQVNERPHTRHLEQHRLASGRAS